MQMQIHRRNVGDVILLDLKGRLTLNEGTQQLKETIDGLMASGAKRIVLNLQEVSYVDSGGLGELVRSLAAVGRHGGSLNIAEGERFPAVRVLVMDAGPKIIDAATREGGMAQLPKRDQDVLQEILRLDHLDVIVPHSRILEQLGYHGPLGPAARANAKAPGGRLVADAITRQLEVAELVLTGIDEVIPA